MRDAGFGEAESGEAEGGNVEWVNFDTTENLYIEGDNLEVLKLLRFADGMSFPTFFLRAFGR